MSDAPNAKYPLDMPMPNRLRYRKYESDLIYKQQRGKFEAAKSRAKAEARDMVFRVAGRLMDRYMMMEHIVQMTYAGLSLPKILEDDSDASNILPVAKEVNDWKKLHKNFENELRSAEEYRAEILASDALDAVLNAGGDADEPTKNQIAHAKLIKESLIEAASHLSEKFQTKTRQQVEDVTERLHPEEIRERIAAMLEANPALLELAKKRGALQNETHDTLDVQEVSLENCSHDTEV